MNCPNCGSDERHGGQFCRACGTELRRVPTETALANAPVTTNPLGVREEIGRAFAYKVSQMDSAHELKRVTEDILPQLEKFLEPPQERRLRRMRAGTITAMAGLGAAFFFTLMGTVGHERDLLPMMALGITAFLIGLGIIINAKWFTVLPEYDNNRVLPDELQGFLASAAAGTQELPPAPARMPYVSVTEHTTRQLQEVMRKDQDRSARTKNGPVL